MVGNGFPVHDMLFEDLFGNFGINLAIGDFGLIADGNHDDGFFFTQADAAGLGDDDTVQ